MIHEVIPLAWKNKLPHQKYKSEISVRVKLILEKKIFILKNQNVSIFNEKSRFHQNWSPTRTNQDIFTNQRFSSNDFRKVAAIWTAVVTEIVCTWIVTSSKHATNHKNLQKTWFVRPKFSTHPSCVWLETICTVDIFMKNK